MKRKFNHLLGKVMHSLMETSWNSEASIAIQSHFGTSIIYANNSLSFAETC